VKFTFTFSFTTTRRLHEKTRANLICLLLYQVQPYNFRVSVPNDNE